MAPMSDEQFRKARRKVRDAMLRLARWKLREMRDKYIGRPRTTRLAKEARALKSLLRHAEGARERNAEGARGRNAEGARGRSAGGAQASDGRHHR